MESEFLTFLKHEKMNETLNVGTRVRLLSYSESINREIDMCIIRKDFRYYMLPTEVLVTGVRNGLYQAEDFELLRNWIGFTKEDVVQRMKEGAYPNYVLYHHYSEVPYNVDITEQVGDYFTAGRGATDNTTIPDLYDTIGTKINEYCMDCLKTYSNDEKEEYDIDLE